MIRADFGINIFTEAASAKEECRRRGGWTERGGCRRGRTPPPRPFRVTRPSIRSSGWFTFTITHLCPDLGSYYSLLTHSSRSWIIYRLDTPLGTAQCCSRGMAVSVRMRADPFSARKGWLFKMMLNVTMEYNGVSRRNFWREIFTNELMDEN